MTRLSMILRMSVLGVVAAAWAGGAIGQDGGSVRDRIRDRAEEFRERRGWQATADRGELEAVLARMKKSNAERLTRMLWPAEDADGAPDQRGPRRLMPRLVELARLLERDPERFEVKLVEFESGMAILDAARAVRDRAAEAKQPPELDWPEVAALSAAVAAGHEARGAVKKLELQRLRARVEAFDREIREAEAVRDERVETQVRRMLNRIGGGESPEAPTRRLPPREDRPSQPSGDD
ncbi:MAG: hypothetical protein AAGF47_00440 [Planctomycetota bacterium]